MNPKSRRTPHLFAVAVLLASAACGDRTTVTDPRAAPNRSSKVISDGAHGGNSDVFFLPPMADNPNKAPGYGDPFQNGLPLVFKIRDLTAAGQPVIKELPGTGSNSEHQYQANWDTKSPALNVSHTYRIEVWIASRMPAFADVDVVSNGSQLKSVNTQQYIGLQDGKTLPLKVRVEKGWACANKAACAAEVVLNNIPVGQKVIVKSNDEMNAVSFQGTWHEGNFPVVVTIEDVSDALGSTEGGCAQGLTTMLANAHCIHITTDPPVTLTSAAVVATCLLNPGDQRQLLMKYDVGETPKYLDDAVPPIVCPESVGFRSHSSNPFVRLASNAMNRVGKAVRWATGTKVAYALDLGVGGLLEPGDDFSYFALSLASEIQVVAGQGQAEPVGNTPLAVAPKVRLAALHHHGADPLYVTTATVTCSVIGAGGTLTVGLSHVATATATNNLDGTYTCPSWTLPSIGGTNTLRISTNQHDAMFLFPGSEGYETVYGTVDFTATAQADLPCSAEGTVHSLNADSGLLPVTFSNTSGESVQIYWLDYSGARVLYNVLANNTSYTQQTFITHPWIMIGATSSTCYGIRMPITGGRTVTIP